MINDDAGTVNIRIASDKDIEVLCLIGVKTFRQAYEGHPLLKNHGDNPIEDYIAETFCAENISRELADSNNRFYIMKLGDEVIGYAKITDDCPPDCVRGARPIHLERIYLLKQFCGVGLGSTLLDHCVGIAVELGKNTIWLGVWDGNHRAIDFYARHGFSRSGSVKFKIANTGYEDTDFIFERDILRE